MQITMRLYRQHDMDLIKLYLNHTINFSAELRKSLEAYRNGQTYQIPVFESQTSYKGYLKPSMMIHVNLNNQKDAQAISVLSNVIPGQRNAFLKALLRRSLTTLPLSAYFQGQELIMSAEKAQKQASDEYVRQLQEPRKTKPKTELESISNTKSTEKTLESLPVPETDIDEFNAPLNSVQDDEELLATLNALSH